MATRDDIFPSKYLKAEDLRGKPAALEITEANVETLKNAAGDSSVKVVLYFKGTSKVLPLNRINFDSVADIAGPDSDDWSGAKVELYPTKTQMGGKTVDCIRVRPPRDQRIIGGAKQPPEPPPIEPPPLGDELADEIPF